EGLKDASIRRSGRRLQRQKFRRGEVSERERVDAPRADAFRANLEFSLRHRLRIRKRRGIGLLKFERPRQTRKRHLPEAAATEEIPRLGFAMSIVDPAMKVFSTHLAKLCPMD